MGARTEGERLIMRKGYILPVLLAAVFALGSFSPVFAEIGNNTDTDDDYTYYYIDDDGKYVEVNGDNSTNTEEEDEDAAFFDAFSTSWFLDHPGQRVYTITTASQLQGLANLVNEGHFDGYAANRYEDFKGVTIKLGRNITLKEDFTPIGRSEEIAFRGIFDGAGHTILGLSVNENGGYAGLFGYLDGTVRDLTVEGTVDSSGPVCGSLAGYVSENGIVWNCASGADVTGKAKTGGIAGFNDGGKIAGCMNYGDVKGTLKVGGVVGENWGTIMKCGNRGEVRSSVRGATTYGTGGVAGRSVSEYSVIDRCFNAGNIFSGTEGTGGVVGYMNARGSEVTSSYNTGHIVVHNNSVIKTDNIRGYAGGIVGIAGVKGLKISDCYNAGSINNSDISGGVIGRYLNESKNNEEPFIKNNYYLNASRLKGVGSDFFGKAVNYREGTEKISPATLINAASKLGPYYVENTQSFYGSEGFPVLKWQVKLGKLETARLSNLTEKRQKSFDRFLLKHPTTSRKEWPILMFFDYSAFTTQAIGDFYEK